MAYTATVPPTAVVAPFSTALALGAISTMMSTPYAAVCRIAASASSVR